MTGKSNSKDRCKPFLSLQAHLRKELGDDVFFSEWSDWSKCNSRCKMIRTRECIRPDVCYENSQSLIRRCENCQKRQGPRRGVTMIPPKEYEYKIYGPWSDWGPCDTSCYTKRIKKCIRDCNGRLPKTQRRQCYVGGDECENRYLERQMRNSTNQRHPKQNLTDYEHPLDNITCGLTKVSGEFRITGGRRVIKGAWPWQVIVLNEWKEHICGGVLLSEWWVLTAAHCVRYKNFVRAGEHDLSYHEGTEQEYKVADVFAYEGYNSFSNEGDIALLRVETPFDFNSYVQPICLPTEEEKKPPFARATIVGWGKRRHNVYYSSTDILHQADVPIVPAAVCRASYKQYFITDKMLCAGFDTGRVDSCRGDSGGPLMDKRQDGTWAVYGVTSFGEGCGKKGKYGVYASVPAHLTWIKAIIEHADTEKGTTEMLTEQTTLMVSREDENSTML